MKFTFQLNKDVGHPMTKPAPFEQILTSDYSRQYMAKRFAISRIWRESGKSDAEFFSIIGEDMHHFGALRDAICSALCSGTQTSGDELALAELQASAATRWKSFLKPRVEVMDYWSSAVGAFLGYSIAGLALLSVLSKPAPSNILYAIATALLGMIFAFKKLSLDRHKCWYKYVIAHLEAIEKVKRSAS